jgi:integrase/recombinase XerD
MTSPVTFSSPLGPGVADYLSLKRRLGRKFVNEGHVLAHLDRFLRAQDPPCAALTPDAFASWCLTLAHLSPTTRRSRMRIVRNLCLYMRRRDPVCFVPDLATFPTPQPPRPPHIFSNAEIVRLLRTTDELQPRSTSPLHAEGYRLAIVLLYTAGLRRGELVRLTLADYDPAEHTLLIRASKFHKSRLVALSADAAREMDGYLVARRRLSHNADSPLLVCSCRGLRARSGSGLGAGLRRLIRRTGVLTADGRPPRVHDLRHTHAVHALLRWYRAGADVQAKLPALAASMGHVSVVSTAYYLALLDPVAQAASERFAVHAAPILDCLPVAGADR